MRVRVNKDHKIFHGSRVYSEGDAIDVPDVVASEWVTAGRVRQVIRSKPVRAPSPVGPEPSSAQAKTK